MLRIKSALCVAFGVVIANAALAQDANETITMSGDTTNVVDRHNGFYHSYWKDSPGTVTIRNLEGGRYTSSWQGVNNWVGGKGWNPGGSKVVSYKGTFNQNIANGSTNSYLALYGWTRNPLVEYYVMESYGNYNPAGCTDGRQDLGTFTSDGVTYRVNTCRRVQQPSIEGTATFMQVFSVRQPKHSYGEVSGTITTQNHFDYWQSKGLQMGSHDYMVMATEGYQSNGNSDITVSEGERDCGTSPRGMPVCCEISADPDGDGFGTQFGNQMCEVTDQTTGWHPPNPSDVVAAINVGGSGDAVKMGDIYYDSHIYVKDATPNSTSDPVQGGDNSIFQSEGYGKTILVDIPVENNQRYLVELGFVEMYWEESGARLFDIEIEGDVVVSNKDLYADHGHDVLWMPPAFEVEVNDGELNIRIMNKADDNATLSSVLVRKDERVASSSSAQSSQVASSSLLAVSSSSASLQSSSSPQAMSSAAASSESMGSSSSASSSVALGSLQGGLVVLLGLLLAFRRRISLR